MDKVFVENEALTKIVQMLSDEDDFSEMGMGKVYKNSDIFPKRSLILFSLHLVKKLDFLEI